MEEEKDLFHGQELSLPSTGGKKVVGRKSGDKGD